MWVVDDNPTKNIKIITKATSVLPTLTSNNERELKSRDKIKNPDKIRPTYSLAGAC